MKIVAILLAASTALGAQWLNYPEAWTPHTSDGKPDLAAPAPRMNGKPDLSGVWQAERTLGDFAKVLGPDPTKLQVDLNDVTKYTDNLFWGMKTEDQPLRPEAAAIVAQRKGLLSPSNSCLPAGIPASLFILTFKMIQAPREIVILHEDQDPPRQIHTDGRPLPNDPQPSWMGYSVGKWEGDKLIVETVGFNDRGWLDVDGHPRSEAMRIRETYHRHDFGHMDLEVTIEDPKYYTRPFTIKTMLNLIPDTDVLENVCAENEKDRAHINK